MPKASKGAIQKWIRTKKIKIDRARCEPNSRIETGQVVQIFLPDDVILSYQFNEPEVEPESLGVDIVYEDDDILIANKPWGMLTHPDRTEFKRTLTTKVQYYLRHLWTPTFKPSCVNRLDKNTSGLVLFCKTYQALKHYNELMRNREIKKHYVSIVEGRLTGEKTIKGYLVKDEKSNTVKILTHETHDSKRVETVVRPLQHKGNYTLVEVDLLTGRSHQIRASLAAIGHPIIGDSKYGGKKLEGVTTQLLHAQIIAFENRTFEKSSQYLDEFWASID
jgi:23S rRNA pseudouridine955/2504/2580 synthase